MLTNVMGIMNVVLTVTATMSLAVTTAIAIRATLAMGTIAFRRRKQIFL